MARIMLDLALEISPDDIEALRLRLDLAREANDLKGRREALARYMRLVPDDDVARLESIRLVIEQEQRLDARVAMVEKMIDGPDAEQLSKPLRSRLASYCAQAAREMGDTKHFNTRAAQALRLDQTNTEAAAMVYDEVIARRRDPRSAGAALMWAIQAEPIAIEPRRKLAEVLLSQGAYQEAVQQFMATQVSATEMQSEGFYHDWILCRAAIGDEQSTDEAIQLLNTYERKIIDAQRAGAPKKQEEDDEAGRVDAEPPVPVLPLDLELLRLAVLRHSGSNMLAQGSFGRIQNALTLKHADDDRAGLDLAWLSAWLGPGVEPEQLARLVAERGDDPVVQRIEAWTALRQKRYDEARQIFEKWADRDPYALYGLARCDRAGPQPEDQTDRLEHLLVERWPASLPGMLAARDLVSDGVTVEPSPAGRWLTNKLEQWPLNLRDPNPHLTPWTTLEIEVEPKQFDAFQTISAKLSVRNNTEVPLAFKPSGTIPSRLFLYVASAQGGDNLATMPPIVVNVGRRLRLEPHEKIELNARIDRSDFGLGMLGRVGQVVTLNVSAILDPYPRPDGGVAHGLIGDRAFEYHLQYSNDPVHLGAFKTWLNTLDEPNPVKRMAAIAMLEHNSSKLFGQVKFRQSQLDRSKKAEEAELDIFDADEEDVARLRLAPDTKDEIKDELKIVRDLIDRIGSSITERFGQMSRVEQAWTIYFIPRTQKTTELFGPVLELARMSKDPLVRVTFLAFHVNNQESQAIDDALAEDNKMIADFGKALRERLQAQPVVRERDS